MPSVSVAHAAADVLAEIFFDASGRSPPPRAQHCSRQLPPSHQPICAASSSPGHAACLWSRASARREKKGLRTVSSFPTKERSSLWNALTSQPLAARASAMEEGAFRFGLVSPERNAVNSSPVTPIENAPNLRRTTCPRRRNPAAECAEDFVRPGGPDASGPHRGGQRPEGHRIADSKLIQN